METIEKGLTVPKSCVDDPLPVNPVVERPHSTIDYVGRVDKGCF